MTCEFFLKHTSRAEHPLDDLIIELDGMLVEEHERFAVTSISKYFSSLCSLLVFHFPICHVDGNVVSGATYR